MFLNVVINSHVRNLQTFWGKNFPQHKDRSTVKQSTLSVFLNLRSIIIYSTKLVHRGEDGYFHNTVIFYPEPNPDPVAVLISDLDQAPLMQIISYRVDPNAPQHC
jgi:hypothetical protein